MDTGGPPGPAQPRRSEISRERRGGQEKGRGRGRGKREGKRKRSDRSTRQHRQ